MKLKFRNKVIIVYLKTFENVRELKCPKISQTIKMNVMIKYKISKL